MLDERKYVTFKRAELAEELTTFPRGSEVYDALLEAALPDAVVIRRQDLFAAPALNSYANGIALALHLLPKDHPDRERLQEVADYFHDQAELASAEGTKVPD